MRADRIVHIVLAMGLFLLAGCAYQTGDEANPITRKATWFSFVAGDDVRAACRPGAPDRFRMIYNGVWAEQARIYEIGFGGPRQLDERVIQPVEISQISISDPLKPWRGQAKSATLSDADYATLLRDLEQSGAYRSPDETLTLAATDFYWVVASCHDGAFHLTAFLYPSPEFAHATFGVWLEAIDSTGIPFNHPRPWAEVAEAAGGTGSPYAVAAAPRHVQPAGVWSFGIAHDQIVDRIEF
jgi:hypothetical protein